MVGRLRLVREVAETAGTSLANASRYISDVGPDAARNSVRAVKNNSTLIGAGGITGVGGLAWQEHREQEVRLAEAAAEEAAAEASAADQLATLVENDDLDPDVRKALIEEITGGLDLGSDEDDDGRPDDGSDGDGDGGLGFFDGLLDLGDGGLDNISGEITKIVILLIALVFVLNWGLAQAGNATAVSAGGVGR